MFWHEIQFLFAVGFLENILSVTLVDHVTMGSGYVYDFLVNPIYICIVT